MSAALELPAPMSLAEFLVWDAPDGARWQLIDGQPHAMAPASPVHGTIQNEVGALLRNHLRAQGTQCRAVANPGVRIELRPDMNYRIPDLAVTCAPLIPGDPMLPDPVLLVEILSPSNPAETWMNVWAYTTIPSVREILVIRTDAAGAQLLRRKPDGTWPYAPDIVEGDVVLDSIGFQMPLAAVYAGTWLSEGIPVR
jgi:Uma2 family endonuclease